MSAFVTISLIRFEMRFFYLGFCCCFLFWMCYAFFQLVLSGFIIEKNVQVSFFLASVLVCICFLASLILIQLSWGRIFVIVFEFFKMAWSTIGAERNRNKNNNIKMNWVSWSEPNIRLLHWILYEVIKCLYYHIQNGSNSCQIHAIHFRL